MLRRGRRWPPSDRIFWSVLGWLVVAAGAYLRLRDFGQSSFWNDEAWVAITTRVTGLGQFWTALSITPLAWAACLRPLAWSGLPPETGLRLLPLAFGALTLWAAYVTGRRLGGHRLGGVLALTVASFDPHAIGYAKALKPYSAETFGCLLALAYAGAFAARRRRRDLIALSLVLALGLPFANSQLFVAGPVLAALLVTAAGARDRRAAARVVVAIAAVAAWDAAYYAVFMAPRQTPALRAYFRGYVPTTSLLAAATFTWERLVDHLAPSWSAAGATLAFGTLPVLALGGRVQRALGLALVLLLGEAVAASAAGRLPFDAVRVLHFLLAALGVGAAGALGYALSRLLPRRALLVVGPALVVALVADRVADRTKAAGVELSVRGVEELGPLVRVMERERRPGDGVLLYGRSGYVYAYYATRPPRIAPAVGPTVGYLPVLDDPDLALLDADGADQAVAAALAAHERVWLLASRFHQGDEPRIRRAFEAQSRVVREVHLPGALLLLAARRSP